VAVVEERQPAHLVRVGLVVVVVIAEIKRAVLVRQDRDLLVVRVILLVVVLVVAGHLL
jgi:hypothetical protein